MEYAVLPSQEQVEALLDPLILKWFKGKYGRFTPPQLGAIYNIHAGRNVLVSAPTGSGKTLAAFLDIINSLYTMEKAGQLEEGVYAVYISPLKALINDIKRNLLTPLSEINEKAKELSERETGITVGIRTGDTTSSEKSRQLKNPPKILCTTPESLAIALVAPKFRERLRTVKWVIVDEIHAMAESKRGSHLSLSLEILNTMADFRRIGLSATIAPIEEVAQFLAGAGRDVTVIDARFDKRVEVRVVSPTSDILHTSEAEISRKAYKIIRDYVKNSRSTIIFTNTRSGAERVASNLKRYFPDVFTDETLGAHHSSVSREIRLDLEERLKRGELRAIVTSTSLELGIDIGYVDLVIQLGSPKSISRMLQRIGRSGHSISSISKGVLIGLDRDELVEEAVMAYYGKKGMLDRIKIVKNPLDVLSQMIVAMSLIKRWNVSEAFEVIKRSYSFMGLKWDDYIDVINYLAGAYHSLEDKGVYSKIRLYKEGVLVDSISYGDYSAEFGKKQSARMIFYLNQGTIPDETKVRVFEGKKPIGTLEEEFVERLVPGDRFVLAGRIYEFVGSKRMRVQVVQAKDKRPTVPAWFSEELPLSYDLANRIQEFRTAAINAGGKRNVYRELNGFPVDRNGKEAIAEYMNYQRLYLKMRGIKGLKPGDYLVENYISDKEYVIFHTLVGRKANDALARAYGHELSRQISGSVGITVSDNGFSLSVERGISYSINGLLSSVSSGNIRAILESAVRNTELFKRKFRHVAARSFMILRNYKGHEISVSKQQFNSERLISAIEMAGGMPVLRETYREILEDYMDIDAAVDFLKRIERGQARFVLLGPHRVPSPFATDIIVMGAPDVILMEDRRAMALKLHEQLMRFLNERER